MLAMAKAVTAKARHPQGELLADEGGQPLSGVDGQAGHHLLDDDVGDGDQHHEEQGAVDELRAGRGVGHDAAGVVAGGGRDQSRPGGGKVDEPPPPRGSTLTSDRLGKWKRPLVGTSASRTSSARIRPMGRPSSSTTTRECRRASTSWSATSSADAWGLTVTTSSSSRSDGHPRVGRGPQGEEDREERHVADQAAVPVRPPPRHRGRCRGARASASRSATFVTVSSAGRVTRVVVMMPPASFSG